MGVALVLDARASSGDLQPVVAAFDVLLAETRSQTAAISQVTGGAHVGPRPRASSAVDEDARDRVTADVALEGSEA